MQYRMQAAYRREVTRQYLRAADVVAPAAPDRRAALQRQLRRRGRLRADRAAADGGRHARDDGDRDRPDAVHRPGDGRRRAAGLPAGDARQRRLPAAVLADLHPHPGAARRAVSEIAHESFDGAMVVKTLGREARGDRAVRRQGARRCATRASAPAGSAPPSTRSWRASPTSGCSPCSASACGGSAAAMADPGDVVTVAYLLTIVAFPIRSIGWMLGEFPRSVVGLRAGAAGARHGQRDDVRRRSGSAPADRGARARRRRPRLRLRAGAGACSTASTSPSSPGARWPSWARPPPARARSPRWSPGSSTRRRAPSASTATTCATSRPASWPRTWRWCRRAPSSSTTPCAATSPWAPTSPDEEVWEALRTAQADGFVAALPRRPRQPARRARHHALRRPAPAALAGPGAGPAATAAGPRRRHLGRRPRGGGAASSPAMRRARRRLDPAADRLPQGDHRAGRRGALPRGRPDRRPRHPRRAARAQPRLRRPSSTPTRPRGWRHERSDARLRRGPDGRAAPSVDSGEEISRPGDDPARARVLARARRGLRLTLLLARDRHGRPGRRTHRGAADPRPRASTGPTGVDIAFVAAMAALAALAIVATGVSSYFMTARLFTASERGLATLRIKAFRHVHDLPLLTQNTERRGALVSRVTSDVDQVSQFLVFGGDLRHRQRRAGAAGDRGDAVLLLAADHPGLGLLPAAVPLAALLPAAAVGGLRRRPPLGRRRCSRRSPSRSSAR